MMDIETIERQGGRSVQTVLGTTKRNKLVFVVVSAIVFCSVMAATLALSPTYEGSTLLLSQSASSNSGDDKTGGMGGGSSWKPPRTLVQIAQSDDVLRAAIQTVGLKRLVGSDSPRVPFFLHLRSLLTAIPPPSVSAMNSWLPQIRSQLDVRGETTSDIITVSYRHPDPAVARAFTAALAQAFIDTEAALYANPGTVVFFKGERQRYEEAFSIASQKFTDFSVHNDLFAPDEQRKNLLKEYSDLTVSIARTQENYISNLAKRTNLLTQLHNLEPAAHSPWVNGLVSALSGGAPSSAMASGQVGDPPTLLIKVYQEAIPDLFKANGDIAASQSLTVQQLSNLSSIENRLRALVANKHQFDILAHDVDQAAADLKTVAKREAAEQVAADFAAAKLQAVKVVQEASVLSRPVFPNYPLILVADVFISALFGIGASNLWDAMTRWIRARRRSRRPVLQAHF